MDKGRQAVDSLIPLLDDDTYEIFAGLYNAQRPASPAKEAELLHYVLEQEYRRTKDPVILHLVEQLNGYHS